MRADTLYYYPDEGRIVAEGNVVIMLEDGNLDYADRGEFSEDFSDGVAVNFSRRMENDAIASAALLERRNGTQNVLTRAVYSACPVCEEDPTPTWRFRARRALHDTEDEMIYYRDVTFQFAGIPVLYFPFYAHPDPTVDRKTGFLLPTIGYSTTLGARYTQPFFWAIDDHHDLLVSPMISSEVTPVLNFEYRRRFWSGFVEAEGSITKEQRFNSSGKFGEDKVRGHIFSSGVFALSDDWSWGFGAERVTDYEYLYRYNIGYSVHAQIIDRGLYGGAHYAGYLISQPFVAGQDKDFYASISALAFQNVVRPVSSDTLPLVLPIAEVRHTLDLEDFGQLELVSDVTALSRGVGSDYARGTAWANWSTRETLSNGVVLEPFGRLRGDYFSVDEAFVPATGVEKSGERGRVSAYAGLDARWPFYRPGEVSFTIEPRVQAIASAGPSTVLDGFARVPYDPLTMTGPTLLLEDSLTAELNGATLFSPNRYAGFDRIEEGGQVNVGVLARADWGFNNSASFLFGRSYHTDPEQFSPASGLDQSWSDYVVETTYSQLGFVLTNRLRIDPDEYKIERLETDGSVNVGPFTLGVGYFSLSEDFTGTESREYLKLGASVDLTDTIALSYSLDRDLENERTQRATFAVTYEDDCLKASVSYLKSQGSPFRAVQEFGGVFFTIGLKTIGDFGVG